MLTESVDPEIVGGLVLKVGELVVDGSVRHDLDRLAERGGLDYARERAREGAASIPRQHRL
mgnify:CR=1 FL=1